MEIVQAIIQAAELERSPVIMQASQGAIRYAGLEYITGMVRIAAENSTVPVALHLDHGTDFDQVIKCIRSGFTSVMFDGSQLPLEENIATTKKILEIARPIGVSVEAELGKIGGTEDDIHVSEAAYTDPEEARYFVEQTGVRSLAVAIGTAHGQYKGEPRLDFDRLAAIQRLVNIPIVLHGSSGVPDEAVRKAISWGAQGQHRHQYPRGLCRGDARGYGGQTGRNRPAADSGPGSRSRHKDYPGEDEGIRQ